MKVWSAVVPLPGPDEPYLPRLLPAEFVYGITSTVITWPIPYVFLLVDGNAFFDEVDKSLEGQWERVRVSLALAAGVARSSTVPKLGLVAAGLDRPLFRTRMGCDLGWHPRAPGSGLLALGAAALLEGTVPSLASGDATAVEWEVLTPAGRRTVAYRLTPSGAPGLAIAIHTSDPKEP